MLQQLLRTWQRRGLEGVLAASKSRILANPAPCFHYIKDRLAGSKGLEIGGPSAIFGARQALPIYPKIGALDCVTFAEQTHWEGKLKDGDPFVFDSSRPAGRQFVCEGGFLASHRDGCYDFVISSHVIEHLANPLAALTEWKRILKPGGYLVLVTPNHVDTFDHRRPITGFEHLQQDYAQCIGEEDMTHFQESMDLHDYDWDPASLRAEEFRSLALENFANRILHHHVFDTGLVKKMLDFLNLEVNAVEWHHPCHILAIARKPRQDS